MYAVCKMYSRKILTSYVRCLEDVGVGGYILHTYVCMYVNTCMYVPCTRYTLAGYIHTFILYVYSTLKATVAIAISQVSIAEFDLKQGLKGPLEEGLRRVVRQQSTCSHENVISIFIRFNLRS